ncbi:hypothetical protein BDR26DRAFT_273061 [Obelidium mucronatum]|nr:hypothetical protein BDR26DRAFT_273061 [Obelidium mucronatum]
MLIWNTPVPLPGISSTSFTCEPCLKGHRSNSCGHWMRRLVEVKGKGRPVSQCAHCRTRRSASAAASASATAAANAEDGSPPPPPPGSAKKPGARAGHSHHKCMCGLQALAATKRNIEARFVHSEGSKTHTVTLVFTSTDHAALARILETHRSSSVSVVQGSKAAAKSTTAAAAAAAAGGGSTSPSISSVKSSPPPSGEGVSSSSSSGASPTAVPPVTVDILFDSMDVSVPDQTALILDNPCSCAFGNPCICGDLSLMMKKKKEPKSKATNLNLSASARTPPQPTATQMPVYTLPNPLPLKGTGTATGDPYFVQTNENILASIQQQTAMGYRPILPLSMLQPHPQPPIAPSPPSSIHQPMQQGVTVKKSCCGSKGGATMPNATSPIISRREDDVLMVNALLGLKQRTATSSEASDVGSNDGGAGGNGDNDEYGDEEQDSDEEEYVGGGCGCGCSCGTEAVIDAISSGGGCCSSKVSAMSLDDPVSGGRGGGGCCG